MPCARRALEGRKGSGGRGCPRPGERRSELSLEAQPERAAVGVVEEAVDRRGPGTGEQRELLGTVGTQSAGWAWTAAAAVVPLLQRLGARVQRGDEQRRVDQVVVLAAVDG